MGEWGHMIQYIMCYFRDESFQPITCTDKDYQTQPKNIQKHKIHKKHKKTNPNANKPVMKNTKCTKIKPKLNRNLNQQSSLGR